MPFKVTIIIFYSLLQAYSANAQDLNWKNSRNWKLYDLHNNASLKYSVDTLKNFKHLKLHDDFVRSHLDGVKELPTETTLLWMGFYIVTCELEDGKTRKLIISNYAGFFFDDSTKKHFEISPSKAEGLMDYLLKKGEEMIAN